MEIRLASLGNADEIGELVRKSLEETYGNLYRMSLLMNSRAVIENHLIAVENNKIVGIIGVTDAFPIEVEKDGKTKTFEGYLMINAYVLPRYRKQKLFSQLFLAALRYLQELGKTKLYISVANKKIEKFVRELGFEKIGKEVEPRKGKRYPYYVGDVRKAEEILEEKLEQT